MKLKILLLFFNSNNNKISLIKSVFIENSDFLSKGISSLGVNNLILQLLLFADQREFLFK